MAEFKVSKETSRHALMGIALFVLIILAVASKGVLW